MSGEKSLLDIAAKVNAKTFGRSSTCTIKKPSEGYLLPQEYLGLQIDSPDKMHRDRNDRKKGESIVAISKAKNYIHTMMLKQFYVYILTNPTNTVL